MLVQKLNVSDLQSGSGTFDGTMVYAQNKVQSVVLETKPTTSLLGGLYTVCFAESFAKIIKKEIIVAFPLHPTCTEMHGQ